MRKIIHIDMDCFYAAIEVRDNPKFRDKPLAVGGSAKCRGVVCSCNYLARSFGVSAAMSTVKALRICPDLIVLPPNMKYYFQISRQIRMIFNEYTPFIEPLSLDEAFLDVTDCKQHKGSATLIAKAIRSKIFRVHNLVASAGVAPNKFLAKIASDWNKPNGIFIITPEEVEPFVFELPVEKIFGVGKVCASKLKQMGVLTCGDLQQLPLLELIRNFGAFGGRLYELVRGIDNRNVEFKRVRKSVSVERTFVEDIDFGERCLEKLTVLFEELQARLTKYKDKQISKLFVKVKFADFRLTSMECVCNELSLEVFRKLFTKAAKRHQMAIRLLGLGVRFVNPEKSRQIDLPGI